MFVIDISYSKRSTSPNLIFFCCIRDFSDLSSFSLQRHVLVSVAEPSPLVYEMEVHSDIMCSDDSAMKSPLQLLRPLENQCVFLVCLFDVPPRSPNYFVFCRGLFFAFLEIPSSLVISECRVVDVQVLLSPLGKSIPQGGDPSEESFYDGGSGPG